MALDDALHKALERRPTVAKMVHQFKAAVLALLDRHYTRDAGTTFATCEHTGTTRRLESLGITGAWELVGTHPRWPEVLRKQVEEALTDTDKLGQKRLKLPSSETSERDKTIMKYFVRLMILSKPFDRSIAQNGLKL